MKAKRLLFLVMAICLASGVKAQSRVINSKPLFFHHYEFQNEKKPPITNPESGILIIRIKNGFIEVYGDREIKTEIVVANLKRDPNYYDRVTFNNYQKYDQYYYTSKVKYDTKMSNEKWTVWSCEYELSYSRFSSQTHYWALKNDFTEFTKWQEPDLILQFDGTETPWGRRIYKGYTKEQLLKITFGGRRDFLN